MRIGDFKETYAADEALLKTPPAVAWMAALGAAVVVFPFVAGDYLVYLANLVGITALSALGLNLLTGFTGQISLGHAAFMGLGAYTTAILASRWQVPMVLALPAAGAVAALAGVVVGAPSLRIKGLYLAMATLAFQVIAEFVFVNADPLTGGVRGINVPAPSLLGLELPTDRALYGPIVALAALGTWFAANVRRSRAGRAFVAVRDRDISAELIGIDLFRVKLVAFAVGSFYAGVAGGLWAYFMKIVTPEHFPIASSIHYLAVIIVGGLGTVAGSLLGAVFMTLVPEALRALAALARPHYPGAMALLSPMTEVVFGALIIGFLLFEPHGLAEIWQRVRRFFRLWPFPH
ncbi:MAG: branched-chain amino acid ABC transporter permease [Deferrisomatales bacterium]|nr:branched-chain amino acid ABC transporter permease [Deferrisomatales bacterium]